MDELSGRRFDDQVEVAQLTGRLLHGKSVQTAAISKVPYYVILKSNQCNLAVDIDTDCNQGLMFWGLVVLHEGDTHNYQANECSSSAIRRSLLSWK